MLSVIQKEEIMRFDVTGPTVVHAVVQIAEHQEGPAKDPAIKTSW
jgi:hypothetical protein